MLLIFLHYQHSFPQLAFPEKPRQQATFTPHPAKGTPECTEVSKLNSILSTETMLAFRTYSRHDLDAMVSPGFDRLP